MSNTLVTSSIVAKDVLDILENTCAFAMNVNRDWQDEYPSNMSRGYAPGATINIEKPPRYTYRTGRVAVPQATIVTTIPLTLSQGGCDINFTSFERTLQITDAKVQKKVQAAVATVVSEIDRQGLAMASAQTFNLLNPTGALPTTQIEATQVLAAVNTRLDIMSAPVKDGNRSFVMGPVLNGALIPGFAGLFNMQERINGQYRTGYMNDAFGLHPLMDQTVATHTNGAATATNINGANQIGSNITVAAVAGGTLEAGTVITLPGVFSVNPQTRQSTGVLANFVVTADTALGATSIPISPAIVTTGAFQNVTASPTTAAPYVIQGTASTGYVDNIGFHKDAFTLAMVPMFAPPEGMGARVAQKTHNGFTVKLTDFYDGINDNCIMRLDVLFGWCAPYAELAVKYRTVA